MNGAQYTPSRSDGTTQVSRWNARCMAVVLESLVPRLSAPTASAFAWRLGLVQTGNMVYTLLGYRVKSFAAATPPQAGSNRPLLGARASRPHSLPASASSPASASGLRGRSPQSSRWGDNYLTPEESKGTLLTYWKNFVPVSDSRPAENERSTLGQARLNGPALQHTLSNYAVSTLAVHIQGISESLHPIFPGHLALSPQRRGNPCGCPVVHGGQETEAGPSGKDSWRQERACQDILLEVWFRRC